MQKFALNIHGKELCVEWGIKACPYVINIVHTQLMKFTLLSLKMLIN